MSQKAKCPRLSPKRPAEVVAWCHRILEATPEQARDMFAPLTRLDYTLLDGPTAGLVQEAVRYAITGTRIA